MRPTTESDDAGEYECMECGNRFTDPETLVCPGCGGPLRSLGPSRDL